MEYCLVLFYLSVVGISASNGIAQEKGLIDFIFSPCRCRCGVPNREAKLKGELTEIQEFPWSSLIQLQNGTKPVPGTIINNKYVLTAATPFINATPYQIKVTIGQHDSCHNDKSSLNISVDTIIVHPDYSQKTKAHDLALIKLSTPITFTRGVSPICLSTPSTTYLGQVATIFGFDRSKGEESGQMSLPSCTPRKLGLPVLDAKSCLLNRNNNKEVTQSNGCVGVIGSKSPVCSEDVGGPVMFRSYGGIYELIGILTDYNNCTIESNLAYYSKINDHLSWITQNTRDSCYCLKI